MVCANPPIRSDIPDSPATVDAVARTSSPTARSVWLARATRSRPRCAAATSRAASTCISSARTRSDSAWSAALALSPRAASASSRCLARSRASFCAVCVTVSDVACSCSADAASCSENAATSSASRCTVEMVVPISSSMRLKLFSRKPSSSDSSAAARTAR